MRNKDSVREVAESLSSDDFSFLECVRSYPNGNDLNLHENWSYEALSKLLKLGVLYRHGNCYLLTEFGKDVWNFEE